MMKRSAVEKNWRMIVEAFVGTRNARQMHASHLADGVSAGAGAAKIQNRWPEITFSESSPVFVLAAGWRTGSTLLQRLLMSDDLLIWGEPYSHCALIDSLASQIKPFNNYWPLNEFFLHGAQRTDLNQDWVANLYPSMQQFYDAHLAYFERLFAQPAAELGKTRWGLKEVVLTSDHACYLRWLFPKAKFIFLYRNPYDAWRSYRRWRHWYRRWPEQPVHTARQFGKMWRIMTQDFLENYQKVDGLLLRYEKLKDPETRLALESHLDCALPAVDSFERIDGTSRRREKTKGYLPKIERALLKQQIEPLCTRLGYA